MDTRGDKREDADEHEGIEDDVDEASWESFPASDAPSWTATGSGPDGDERRRNAKD